MTCTWHLINSIAVTNRIFLSEKTYFPLCVRNMFLVTIYLKYHPQTKTISKNDTANFNIWFSCLTAVFLKIVMIINNWGTRYSAFIVNLEILMLWLHRAYWDYGSITSSQNNFKSSDVDPDWLYPDPDPQSLMNPDPGQYNYRIDLKHVIKIKYKLLFF